MGRGKDKKGGKDEDDECDDKIKEEDICEEEEEKPKKGKKDEVSGKKLQDEKEKIQKQICEDYDREMKKKIAGAKEHSMFAKIFATLIDAIKAMLPAALTKRFPGLRPSPAYLSSRSGSKEDSFLLKMGLGEYPPDYNPKVHGPYDPARYYGKPDTPFGQVKLSELPAWIGRRNKSPRAIVQLFDRAIWRWQYKYMLPLRAGFAPAVQFVVFSSTLFYIINYGKLKNHYLYKYH